MDSPFVYLTLCSLRNQLRVRLTRLKQPRYLAGSIVGLAYLFLIFGRPLTRSRRPGTPPFLGELVHSSTTLAIGAVALLLLVAIAWWWPGTRRPALTFTRADVQFLFTAPIERWRLVRYKILRSQMGAFFGSAIITLVVRPANVTQAWTFWLGMTVTMAIVNLHLTGISLAGDTDRRSRHARLAWWGPRLVVGVNTVVVAADLAIRWPASGSAPAAGGTVITELTQILLSGASGLVLWPFVMLVRLPLADSLTAFAMALPAAVIALGLNYVWVLRTDTPFEEGSAELAEKLARVRTEGMSALRESRPVSTPFRLAPGGRPEMAVLWKNLISMGRFLSWTVLLRVVPVVMLAVSFLARGGRGSNGARADSFAMLFLICAAIVVWMGPQIARADLRQDLPNLAVLRTWPMRGATLVRGEVLAPAIVLVSIAWVALTAAAIFAVNGSPRVQVADPWAYLTAALAVAPGVIVLQLLVQNALAVTFPSWVAIGPRRGGVDVIGQRMLMTVGSVLAVALALVPALIVAGIVFTGVRWLTGGSPIVLTSLAAAAVLLVEAFVGSELVGLILDRTDVSALDPPDA